MCGVIGVSGSPEAAKEVFLGLISLQHRGQDAAGILSADESGFHLEKNIGLVESIFSKEAMDRLKGSIAIGHTRYATVGRGSVDDVQPLVLNYPYGIGVVHNGNIVNYHQIKDRLIKEMRRSCLTGSDTEALLNWFAHHLSGVDFASIENAVREVFSALHGSYSVVGLLSGGGLFAFRDPHGIRPLVLGQKKTPHGVATMVASESLPLSLMGYEKVRDLQPGELVHIDPKGQMRSQTRLISAEKTEHRPCMFEWVYFASAESEIENTPVYSARLELGKTLAQEIRTRMDRGEIEADLVAPVPDTSRTAAAALAEELRLPYREVLIKNRYIKRTFILNTEEKRQKAVDLKLNLVLSEIRGKSILLVDDSIVRGTTSRKIVERVRKAGAKRVYFVSTCPPIRYPCFYGIDFPDQGELIAAGKTETEVAQELGADGVVYQSHEGLKRSLKVKNPCTACLDGQYPTDVSESKRFARVRRQERLS